MMVKQAKVMALLIVFCLMAFVVAGCGGEESSTKTQSDNETQNSIKIGFLGAKTGDQATYGIETLKGIKMAAEDINNSGGLLGKDVVIVEEDHGSKKAEGASVTQKLITDGCVAVVGDPTTGITKVAAPIAQSAGAVLLSAGAVGPGVVEIGDFIYRDCLLDRFSVPAITKYLKNTLGWNKVFVVTSKNNDYSVGQSDLFRKSLKENGIEIVGEQSIQDGDQNFSAQVTSMKQKQFDGIVFTGYYTEGGLFMKEVRKQGLEQVFVGGDGLLSPILWEMGDQDVEGCMVFAGFAADPANATGKTKEFIEKYQKINNGNLPDMFSAQGYDAVMLIADAIRNAGSDKPADFKETLKKTENWQGVTGTITFCADREPIKSPVYLLEVKNQAFSVKATIPVTA